VLITQSVYDSNKATDTSPLHNGSANGGGGYATEVSCLFGVIQGNEASGQGGGMAASIVSLNDSTVSGNSAASGGGINASQSAVVTQSAITGNSATSRYASGGGVNGGDVTITNPRQAATASRGNGS
jgi:predicted outer membrane repeat protein